MKHTVLTIFLAVILPIAPATAEEEWRTFRNTKGQSFEGKVVEVNKEQKTAKVEVRGSRQVATLKFEVLVEDDVAYLNTWEAPEVVPDAGDDAADLGEASSRFYPHTKAEIQEKLKEISEREAPNGIDDIQQEAVNTLNVYRFLCGVPDNAEADKRMVEEATDAANACKEHGGLSHKIGRSTEKCNLTGYGDIVRSVRAYIEDAGDNNRVHRGHRRWCLNPALKKTGFGTAGKHYSAMWALDESGRSQRDPWSYPGKGFFPIDKLHGNGWSFYLPSAAPAKDDLTVEVFKLSKRPQKTFGMTEDIPGEKLPVGYVATDLNSINFEPKPKKISEPGIYWVRIKGRKVRESYVVELY